MPSYVKGVINLRGKVIPVIDVRRRFKLKEREDDDKTCIVVVNINNTLIGLVVDAVNDVARIPENQIVSPPDFSEKNCQLFVKGLGKVKILLITILILCSPCFLTSLLFMNAKLLLVIN